MATDKEREQRCSMPAPPAGRSRPRRWPPKPCKLRSGRSQYLDGDTAGPQTGPPPRPRSPGATSWLRQSRPGCRRSTATSPQREQRVRRVRRAGSVRSRARVQCGASTDLAASNSTRSRSCAAMVRTLKLMRPRSGGTQNLSIGAAEIVCVQGFEVVKVARAKAA